jgi:hypothetical protein
MRGVNGWMNEWMTGEWKVNGDWMSKKIYEWMCE